MPNPYSWKRLDEIARQLPKTSLTDDEMDSVVKLHIRLSNIIQNHTAESFLAFYKKKHPKAFSVLNNLIGKMIKVTETRILAKVGEEEYRKLQSPFFCNNILVNPLDNSKIAIKGCCISKDNNDRPFYSPYAYIVSLKDLTSGKTLVEPDDHNNEYIEKCKQYFPPNDGISFTTDDIEEE